LIDELWQFIRRYCHVLGVRNLKIEIQKKSLFQGERIDEIGFNDLRLIQKPEYFCYGLDAVILADFAATGRAGNRIMDLGTGTGIIPIILSHKTDASEIYGLEVQADSYSRACRNVELNGLSGGSRFCKEMLRIYARTKRLMRDKRRLMQCKGHLIR